MHVACTQQHGVGRDLVEGQARAKIVALADIERLPRPVVLSLGIDENARSPRCALADPLNGEREPARTVRRDETQGPNMAFRAMRYPAGVA